MFRIIFEPEVPKSSGDYIAVLDKVYEEFSSFKIDMANREVIVDLQPNYQKGWKTLEEVKVRLQEWWDMSKLSYYYDRAGFTVHISIPSKYNVQVILK